jgi:hypothetical protein
MDVEAIGKMGGIMGAGAIGVGLVVWMAGVIRQSIREAQLIAFQNTANRHQQWHADLAREPDLARIYVAGLDSPQALNEIDRIRFESLASSLFRNWEDEFLHYARGMVDDEIFAGRRNAFKIHLTKPGMRWYWTERRSHFTESFAKYVDFELKSLERSEAERWVPEQPSEQIASYSATWGAKASMKASSHCRSMVHSSTATSPRPMSFRDMRTAEPRIPASRSPPARHTVTHVPHPTSSTRR